jgi:hypothetical protein
MTDKHPSAPAPAKTRQSHSGVIHENEPHTENFTVVGNHLLQHPELSLLAIGLAVHIQSLPAGAPVGIKTLAGRFPEGEIRIAAALRELEEHGYLTRARERLHSGASDHPDDLVQQAAPHDDPRGGGSRACARARAGPR